MGYEFEGLICLMQI